MCEAEETENEDQPQRPGIDFVVSREQLDQVDVNQMLSGVKGVECFDINRVLSDSDGKRPEEQLSALRLLAGLTSYHFDPDHRTEPFKPMWIMDGRRSLIRQISLMSKSM